MRSVLFQGIWKTVFSVCGSAIHKPFWMCDVCWFGSSHTNEDITSKMKTMLFRITMQRAMVIPYWHGDISARHAVGLFWVPGHARVRGNEIADKFARGGLAQRFFWTWACLGVFKAEYKKKDETLDREQTSSIVALSLQYTETGLRIDLWPLSGYGGLTTVL
jgi:hypothetical protein